MVLVIGNNGHGLMPTTERKARILLKEKKAVVVRKVPYTRRLHLWLRGGEILPR